MANAGIEESIERYLKNMERSEKPKSTIVAYKTDYNIFKKYMTEEKKIHYIEEITEDDFFDYKDYLIQVKNYKTATVNRKLNSLKSLFTYLEKINVISTNYISVIATRRPFQDKKQIDLLEDYEVEELITLPSKLKFNENWRRDAGVLYLLAFFGLRRSEILGLKARDFDVEKQTLGVVRQKTNTFDILPLNERTFVAISGYIKTRKIKSEEEYLFLGDKGGRMSETAFSKMIKKYAEKSNINKEITAYSFRHKFITNLIEEGLTDQEIIKWTGHTDVRTLDTYIHNTTTMKERVIGNSFKTFNRNRIENLFKKK